jgi:hypothetical protein
MDSGRVTPEQISRKIFPAGMLVKGDVEILDGIVVWGGTAPHEEGVVPVWVSSFVSWSS